MDEYTKQVKIKVDLYNIMINEIFDKIDENFNKVIKIRDMREKIKHEYYNNGYSVIHWKKRD
jgi:hypothetical protein